MPIFSLRFALRPRLDRDSHQVADADRVKFLEGVFLVDSAIEVVAEELAGVVRAKFRTSFE